MFAQFSEAADDEQLLRSRSRINLFMFQNPGISVGNEYRVQPRGQGRIDVGFRTIADHPGRIMIQAELPDDSRIGICIFLGHHLDDRKIFPHS